MWCTVNKPREEAPFENAYSDINADILLLYLTHQTILNLHISYQHHIVIIISLLILSITSLIKVALKNRGSDSLPDWFLKLISAAICEPLSTIYNNCIKRAFYPA